MSYSGFLTVREELVSTYLRDQQARLSQSFRRAFSLSVSTGMRYNKHKRITRKERTFIWVKGNKVYLNPARSIPAMKYYDYITSAYWKARKLRYYHFNEKKCAVCETTTDIQLHHLCYDPKKYGAEPDSDLVPLCTNHHQQFHQVHGGVPPKMKEKTRDFIQTMRQVEQSNIDDLSWISSC